VKLLQAVSEVCNPVSDEFRSCVAENGTKLGKRNVGGCVVAKARMRILGAQNCKCNQPWLQYKRDQEGRYLAGTREFTWRSGLLSY